MKKTYQGVGSVSDTLWLSSSVELSDSKREKGNASVK
jgi:hypothetical protein